jgi:hypothetical protein
MNRMTAETNMLVFTLAGLILLPNICVSFYSSSREYVEKSRKKDTPSFDSVKFFLRAGELGWDDLWHDCEPLSLGC